MTKTTIDPEVARHFDGKAQNVRATYDAVLSASRKFGRVVEEPKKTSIHLTNRTAFAGVQTRREYLILTIKSTRDIESGRVWKREQTSPNRWHLEVKLETPADVDVELKSWLRDAYVMSA